MAVYRAITSAADFKVRVDMLIEEGKPFGFDIESGYTGPPATKLATKTQHPNWLFVGFSYTNSDKWADYVPLWHDDETQNVPEDEKLSVIKDLYRLLRTGKWVAHNAMFELLGTSRIFREYLSDDPDYGPEIQKTQGFLPFLHDTMLLAFNLDTWHGQYSRVPDENGRPTREYKKTIVGKGLKELVWHLLNHKMIEFDDLFVDYNLRIKGHARFNMLDVTEQVIRYACEDSLYCLQLLKFEAKEVAQDTKNGEYDNTCYVIDKDVLKPTFYMEQVGLNLDFKFLKEKLEEAELLRDEMAEEILQKLSEMLGYEVNINLGSTQQVAKILYDELKIPQPKERGKETRSTSEKNLQAISKSNPIIRDILTYRTVTKLIGSYLKKYVTELDYYGDGRAWPEHNTTGAITGRFSVGGMSYQQLPKPYFYKLKNGREYHLSFRDAILAPEGYRIVGFDFSQIQLRAMAGMANERVMIKAFRDGTDIHTATASAMLKIPTDKVTGKDRSKGKTLNFSVVFGTGPDALAEGLTTPQEPVTTADAEKLLKMYYDGYPDLRGWMDGLQSHASQGSGYFVRGLFGRRYQIWEYQSDLRGVQNKGDRMAVNEPVQGAEAYYMKRAMIQVHEAITNAGLQDKIKLFMMVHDALEFYVHESVSTQEVIDLLYSKVTYSDPKYMEGWPIIDSDWHEGETLGSVIEIDLDDNKKIIGYNVTAEVMTDEGLLEKSFAGKTFHEVNSEYQEWKRTEHPEVLAKKRMSGEIPTFEIDVEEGIGDMETFKKLISTPGSNKVRINFKTKNVSKDITCGLTKEDIPELEKAINYVKEEAPF